MQNYNNAPQPPGGYGPQGGWGAMPPPPPPKKGMSKGLKIFLVVALVLMLGGAVLVIAGGVGFYFLTRRTQEVSGVSMPGRSGLASKSATAAADDSAEGPSPTSEQTAAIAGGQTAEWSQQEITWTVPQKWRQHSADSRTLLWRSPGSWDAASLIVSVAPMSANFPTEVSLNAFYDQAEQRKANGEVDEYRWLKLDGVKGVLFRESSPEDSDGPQRLQWMAYRDYKGQKQLINIMLAARGKDFARHEDALYGILYSTKLSQ